MIIIPNAIPIAFMGGTGGHFLTSLLIKAKHNDFNHINLSKSGHAHGNQMDIGSKARSMGTVLPDSNKIDLLKHDFTILGTATPYFFPLHLQDLKSYRHFFDKVIRITYTSSDIAIINFAFLAKHTIEDKKLPVDMGLFTKRCLLLVRVNQYFTDETPIDDVLYISWKELYQESVSVLINKLSNFTNIPKLNFNESSIYSWRETTNQGILKLRKTLSHRDNQ
jgi:hypothetical protein